MFCNLFIFVLMTMGSIMFMVGLDIWLSIIKCGVTHHNTTEGLPVLMKAR